MKLETRNFPVTSQLFCLNALNVQMNLDILSDDQSSGIERFVPHHAEVFAIQFAIGSESGSRVPPWVFRDAVQCAGEGDFFGHAVEREMADDLVGLSVFLSGFHLVGDRRELFGIQEVGIPQMPITFLVVRIDRVGIDGRLDGFESFCGRIQFDESTIVREPP